ncbi:hypothetical protein H5410_062865 [Solanum commersonii]|uniref:GTP-binding protein TrmE N-terminal domain-containing protein n=1 Tax=Solanum commersonii TaxID=4109 RepID=A0A9J5WBK8_SOLCO|nr:hypothetical protein H5410_062865 [Solanum commersonii]
MAPKKEAKKESSSTSTHQPAIGTRTSSRTAKPNLDSNSDPQQPPVNVAPSSFGSGKAKLGSNPKPPRFNKAETKNSDGGGGESSSMDFKKKANSGPAAIGTQSSARQRGKGKVESDPKPPKSKKVETKISDGSGGESSSMDSKKKANSGPAVIGTRSSAQQRGKDKVGPSVLYDSVSQPPKSEKAETNTSGGVGGESSSMDSKNKANTETAAIVTQRSTRQQRGKGKVDSNVPPDSVSQPPKSKKGETTNNTAGGASSPATATASRRSNEIPKSPVVHKPIISPNTRSSSTKISRTSSYEGNARVSGPAKKRLNMEPSSSTGRRDKGKAKLVPSEDNAPEDMKDKNYPSMFKPVSITSSEANAVLAKRLPLKKRAVVLPTSSVLTRQGKARMANPQPPKSTASTAGSARRRKPKTDSDPTPPADPQPPKSEKAKTTPSTSVSTRRGKAQMSTGPTPKGRASISRGKTEMGSDPTPPSSSTRGNSSVSATPRNKTTVEPSSRVLRSENTMVLKELFYNYTFNLFIAENLVVLNTSTIAAIVTSLGGPAAAVGIIRLSGLSAVPIVGRVFHPKVIKKKISSSDWRPRSHVVEYGFVSDSHGNVIDEVPMLAPKSYNREDVIELQCHGSEVCLQRVLRACLEAGVKLTEPALVTRPIHKPQFRTSFAVSPVKVLGERKHHRPSNY